MTSDTSAFPSVSPPWLHRLAAGVYGALWTVALPFLGLSPRLRAGFPERLHGPDNLSGVDLWLQASSGGESFLAVEILRGLSASLPKGRRLSVLTTTGTIQGREVLDKAGVSVLHNIDLRLAYFPFDRPSTMRRLFASLRPGLAVVLETELWPGFFLEARRAGVPLAILNARLSERSLRGYALTAGFWRDVAPVRVLAISPEDALRYAAIFGPERVGVMPNIKFDRVRPPRVCPDFPGLPPDALLAVLGSVREEEEPEVFALLLRLREARPDVIIGLYPRHMHRIEAWVKRLEGARIPYRRRSSGQPVAGGDVLLGDVFGELAAAYARAATVFVGGSLRPLGGQNFLEPLGCGVRPVIGPHWRNFLWIGEDIFTAGLARRAPDASSVAAIMLDDLAAADDRLIDPLDVAARAEAFLESRRGGTAVACAAMEEILKERGRL